MSDSIVAQTSRDLVLRFWELMATNQFGRVCEVCHAALIVDWPQTGERIRGIDNFERLNHEYPAHGPWTFSVQRVLADGEQAVSEVDVTDGVQKGHAISFFTIRTGRIAHILEYWPDPALAPAHRAHLVESLPLT